jgi:hypothetical protein
MRMVALISDNLVCESEKETASFLLTIGNGCANLGERNKPLPKKCVASTLSLLEGMRLEALGERDVENFHGS